MKKKSKYPPIAGILVLLMCLSILVFHFSNFRRITNMQFSSDWGVPTNVHALSQTDGFLAFSNNQSPYTMIINPKGYALQTEYAQSGELINETDYQIEPFSSDSLSSILYFSDSIYYLTEGTLQKFSLEKKKSSSLLNSIVSFSIIETKKDTLLLLAKEDSIEIRILNEPETLLFTMPLAGSIKKIDIEWINESYLMAYVKEGGRSVVQELEIINLTDASASMVTDLSVNLGYLSNIELFEIQEKLYLTYTKYTGKKGIFQTYFFLEELDKNTYESLANIEITASRLPISDMKNFLTVVPHEDGVDFYGVGRNKQNYFHQDGADIFKIHFSTLDKNTSAEFISTSVEPVLNFYVFPIADMDFVISRNIFTSQEHMLKMNSNAKGFKESNQSSKMYISDGIMTSFSGMIYAGVMMFPRLLYIVLYLAPLAFILFLLQKFRVLQSNKVLAIIVSLSYVVINLLTIDFFFGGIGNLFMPDIFLSSFGKYVLPLIINLLCFIAAFIHSKSLKRPNYILYSALFILLDVFIASQLFLPFTMLLAN